MPSAVIQGPLIGTAGATAAAPPPLPPPPLPPPSPLPPPPSRSAPPPPPPPHRRHPAHPGTIVDVVQLPKLFLCRLAARCRRPAGRPRNFRSPRSVGALPPPPPPSSSRPHPPPYCRRRCVVSHAVAVPAGCTLPPVGRPAAANLIAAVGRRSGGAPLPPHRRHPARCRPAVDAVSFLTLLFFPLRVRRRRSSRLAAPNLVAPVDRLAAAARDHRRERRLPPTVVATPPALVLPLASFVGMRCL